MTTSGQNSSYGITARYRLTNGKILDSNKNYGRGLESDGTYDTIKKSAKSGTLQDREVPQFLREPFITSGYRDSDNITVRQCLATLFTIHNETFNIWSHLAALAGFLIYFISIACKLSTMCVQIQRFLSFKI